MERPSSFGSWTNVSISLREVSFKLATDLHPWLRCCRPLRSREEPSAERRKRALFQISACGSSNAAGSPTNNAPVRVVEAESQSGRLVDSGYAGHAAQNDGSPLRDI